MPKKIVIGITGSIAAFKAIQLISDLTKTDYELEVIMTKSACQFVTPLSIQSLTKKKVYVDVFDDDIGHITHIDIVKGASLFMVVPASANTIAKLANGIADNMLTASFLAATCPKLIAPAMNVNMYQNRATQRNINQLKKDGVLFVEPDTGLLACGVVGKGKLADFATIRLMMDYALSEHPLLGKKVLVSAGPTQESLDPVRFISNHSTGKMGYAIARAAFLLGAQVKIISGPVNITLPLVEIEHITTANEMYDALVNLAPFYDYIIMSAAVGDYRAEHIAENKIKKSDDTLTITFNKNRDILRESIGKCQEKAYQQKCRYDCCQ